MGLCTAFGGEGSKGRCRLWWWCAVRAGGRLVAALAVALGGLAGVLGTDVLSASLEAGVFAGSLAAAAAVAWPVLGPFLEVSRFAGGWVGGRVVQWDTQRGLLHDGGRLVVRGLALQHHRVTTRSRKCSNHYVGSNWF